MFSKTTLCASSSACITKSLPAKKNLLFAAPKDMRGLFFSYLTSKEIGRSLIRTDKAMSNMVSQSHSEFKTIKQGHRIFFGIQQQLSHQAQTLLANINGYLFLAKNEINLSVQELNNIPQLSLKLNAHALAQGTKLFLERAHYFPEGIQLTLLSKNNFLLSLGEYLINSTQLHGFKHDPRKLIILFDNNSCGYELLKKHQLNVNAVINMDINAVVIHYGNQQAFRSDVTFTIDNLDEFIKSHTDCALPFMAKLLHEEMREKFHAFIPNIKDRDKLINLFPDYKERIVKMFEARSYVREECIIS